MITYRKITIIQTKKPNVGGINQKLQWMANSLGLFNLRDKDNTCFRIFVELIKTAKQQNAITSDELAYRLGLSRGTIVHHLNKLRETGIVTSRKNGYFLRVSNLKELVNSVENDINRTITELKGLADELDNMLGLD